MALNQYYRFAVGAGSPNTLTNSAYAALTTLLGTGFVPGVASSEQINTVLRQATVGVAGVAQFSANNQAADVLDDGSPANFAAHLQGAIEALIAAQNVPPGTIAAHLDLVSAAIPTGWLECNGASLLRATYPRLFAKLGTFYGGDASHFSLPDLRGEFLRGWDHGRGIDIGRAQGSSQTQDLQAHTHTYNQASAAVPGVSEGGGRDSAGALASVTGSTGATETRPRNVSAIYIIKY